MPGKKRKADSSSSMWGSSNSSNSSSPSSSRRSGSNKQSSSSRRGGGGAQGSGAYPYINEEGASKLFEEICEEDDPNVAGMEGELWNDIYLFLIALHVTDVYCVYCTLLVEPSLIIIIIIHTIFVRDLQAMRTTRPRPHRRRSCPRPPLQTRRQQKASRNKQGGMDDGV